MLTEKEKVQLQELEANTSRSEKEQADYLALITKRDDNSAPVEK